jgi:ribonuclease HIII
VRDSKTLNDRTIRRLAADIRSLAPHFAKVTKIPPRTYNELYEQFRREGKNLNQLLAWGHVRSIEDLLKRGIQAELAVVDQFADRRYIEDRILQQTRESRMEILQFPKAEADIAVAAASVLARDAFLEWFEQASTELGWLPPKGASQQVIEAARRLVAEKGQVALRDYAKLSFKTTASVLA